MRTGAWRAPTGRRCREASVRPWAGGSVPQAPSGLRSGAVDDRDMHELLGPEGRFGHREHLHLAWRALQAHDHDAAVADVEAAIRRIAAAHGAPGKYHR